MGKAKKQRTKDFKDAVINHLCNNEIADRREQYEFDKLVNNGVLVEVKCGRQSMACGVV